MRRADWQQPKPGGSTLLALQVDVEPFDRLALVVANRFAHEGFDAKAVLGGQAPHIGLGVGIAQTAEQLHRAAGGGELDREAEQRARSAAACTLANTGARSPT